MWKEVGFIGLGKMGRAIVRRLLKHEYQVMAYDLLPEAIKVVEAQGANGISSLEELISHLQPQRIIWLMVPAGDPVDEVINRLVNIGLNVGDIIIDGGNSNYHDTIRRATALEARGVFYLDVGVSGGPGGAEVGFSLTVGGSKSAYKTIEPILEILATPEGYAYIGPSGSGHFVKMVHNAIEYGMMQAIGEGFELLANGPYKSLDLETIARVWRHGSVIRSFLIELAERAFEKDPKLIKVADYVEDTGEGRWALQEAINFNIPFDTIAHALFARMCSRQDESFAAKVVAILRHEFGGHEIK
jgi:6-phosphogluconate dehydrogenase